MAPRPNTLPEPITDSARQAREAFYCDLCKKGYARVTDYNTHLMSYDHSHHARDKESRQLLNNLKGRDDEEENSAMRPMTLEPKVPGGVKKKPVFKSANNFKSAEDIAMEGADDAIKANNPVDEDDVNDITNINYIDNANYQAPPIHATTYIPNPMLSIRPETQKALDIYLEDEERFDKNDESRGLRPPVGVVHPGVIAMRASPSICPGGEECACVDVDSEWAWDYDWGLLKDILRAEGFGYWRPDVEWSQMVEGMTT